jgi:hypothetical protein
VCPHKIKSIETKEETATRSKEILIAQVKRGHQKGGREEVARIEARDDWESGGVKAR